MKKPLEPYYRIPDNTLFCPHCEQTYKVTLPQPVWAMAALCRAFCKEHLECTEEPKDDDE